MRIQSLIKSVRNTKEFPILYGSFRILVFLIKQMIIILLKLGFIKFAEHHLQHVPITVAARCKACTVFTHSNIGIMGSNPTECTDVCVLLFCV
jgi:hypothetical protein